MRKLLRAIFSRLLRDRAFRLIAVLMMASRGIDGGDKCRAHQP